MSKYRMDYIGKFELGTIEKMQAIRQRYIELEMDIDRLMQEYIERGGNITEQEKRVLNEAFTQLEKSQMYTIKFLCLAGEAKEYEH